MSWTPPPPRPGHPYFMHDAIYAQPGALRLVTRGNEAALDDAAERLRGMERVLLSGIGTSWHACLVGELLFAQVGRLAYRARAFHSFELKSYWPDFDMRTGVVVVSHRGSKRYSREALEKAKATSGVGVVITGKGHDNLTVADYTLRTVDQEGSAAHTVSFTCAMALLAQIAARIGANQAKGADAPLGLPRQAKGADAPLGLPRDAIPHALDAIPDQLALLLGQESWDELATRFADRRRFWFVGGGPNTATALEAALKMSEANHASAIGYNCEQFMHGPVTAVESEDVVFVVAPPGPSRERCVMAARAVKEIGAPVVALVREDDREMAALAAETIAIPDVPELLSPILTVVPLQLFTYHLALTRGVNPDTMRTGEPAHGRAFRAISL